ncbi:MAG: ATP-binding protein [Coriobacteriaceae bacterium]|nr:ATP-binding protein [Coriobacteriaceae bacterium]
MAANPFKPTAGKVPPVLIGRQDILDDFAEALENGAGAPGRLMLITGQRGFGKTVMLSELRACANRQGWFVVADNASVGMCDRLVRAIQPQGVKLRGLSIEPSIGMPGGLNASFGGMTLETPVPDAVSLRAAINERLKKMPKGKGILIAIDETQGVSMGDVVALATTFQHVLADQDMTDVPDSEKKGIAFVFAALPSLMDDVLENKVITFLRRAVRHTLAEVPLVETRDAYVDVIAASGKHVEPDLALQAARAAGGHPYMVQLIGYHMWRSAHRRDSEAIEKADVVAGIRDARLAFYEAICAPVYYGLRSPQRLFIEQMAKDEGGNTRIADVMQRAERTESWAHKYRASLIRERVIEPAGHGLVHFCVPLLGDYIRDEVFWHEPE